MVACESQTRTFIKYRELKMMQMQMLMLGIGASGHYEVVIELVNAGADVKTTNDKEQTPL